MSLLKNITSYFKHHSGKSCKKFCTPFSRKVPLQARSIFSSYSIKNVTSLAEAFNSKQNNLLPFSVKKNPTGLFGIPELRSSAGFHLLKEHAVLEAEDLLTEGCSNNRTRKMVEVFDELSNTLCKVADMAEFIRMAHPNSEFKYAAQEASFTIGSLVEKLNVHRPFYDQLRKVVENGDILPTTPLDEHVARLFLFDFEQCGIHLIEEKRQLVAGLNEAILSIGQKFMHKCHQPRQVPRSSLPDSARHYFGLLGDTVSVHSLQSESPLESTRETSYRLYLSVDSHQELLLQQLLDARKQMAQLCGFKSFAHRTLKGSLTENPETVHSFLTSVSETVHPLAQADYNAIREMKYKYTTEAKDVAVWDVPYYTTFAKVNTLIDASGGVLPELSHYFSLGSVMAGLDHLMRCLFGVTLQHCTPDPGELWSDDVQKLAVKEVEEEGGELLGHIYCDFTERRGKPHQDCHFTIRGGKLLTDGSYQTPVVVVQLSLPSASWTTPPLLSPAMLDNLFHEMGHAMHSMLARTRYQHITGTRCSTDFAEVPSILMEYFANDARVLSTFARHYKSDEPMPPQLMAAMIKSKSVFASSELQTQLFYSAVDQRYHSEDPLSGRSTTDVMKEEHKKHYGLPYVDDTAWQLRFSHFVGYGGKYYSYLVSRAVASWIWQTYFQDDPFSRSAGMRYRKEVLQHGGGVPPRQLVTDFLSRPITSESLTEALLLDLQQKCSR